MKKLFIISAVAAFIACGKAPEVTDGGIVFVKGSAIIEHIESDGSKKDPSGTPG